VRSKSQAKGITKIELVVVLAATLVLTAALLPSLQRWREMARRQRCAEQLNNMGKAFYTYCGASDDNWPVAPHAAPPQGAEGLTRYAPGLIGNQRERETTLRDTQVSTTRSMWIVVRSGALRPDDFVCPASGDGSNTDQSPAAWWDFKNFSEVSYGYQMPYGKWGRPNGDRDGRMPLAADKGPYSVGLEAGAQSPGPPPALSVSAPSSAWRSWNSPNHGRQGQNVLIADSHVKFVDTPAVGMAQDNIYTQWLAAEPTALSVSQGRPPTGVETPMSDTDTLIYP
jgi:type II secretory pathway pseudopilin PulG